MLKVTNLNVHYGMIHAVQDVGFEVDDGEIITLIGANGAGKTTILRAISGIKRKTGGQVEWNGRDITKLSPDVIVSSGLIQVPEGRRIFLQMTIAENLLMGAYSRSDQQEIKADMKRVYDRFPILFERRGQIAGMLSGGEQQMLAIGRALMARPKLLLLDEPSMGLAPLMVKQVFDIIADLNKSGTTILLVEQNAHAALSIANRAYVLETGRIILSGEARALLNDPGVREAYLG